MIANINELKRSTNLPEVKSLCETTIAAMSSAIYNGVTPEARFEIERVATENLFEGLSKFSTDKMISEWLDNQKRIYSIKNIGVRKAINNLKESDGKNDPTLAQILEHFEDKLEKYPEVLLYEEFIGVLSGDYNWMPSVNEQIRLVSEKVNEYKSDIDITKIIETMKTTKSNYLLPLIEDVVNNYINNKTEQTKSHLKETLVKFSYDPFVRDLINIVMLDAQDLQLEYANAQSAIEKVYSPLMYLGENEVAFNIKGTFYVKKGNNINKIKREEVENLDENFRALCEAINVPNVEFSKNSIKVYVGNNVAEISEGKVVVNTHEMNEQEFAAQTEISQWTGDTNFYLLTKQLQENFDEIVEVDFAKRVYLKEDEGYAADIMKLRNNIYITTFDPINNKATFYRNINPIQAEKVMMEHMRFDVSKTFADILPNKEKILKEINETKKEYINYIKTLENKIVEFESQPYNKNITKEVISVLKEELNDVKSEYKDYVNEIEKYTEISENVVISLDVDGEKYKIPIPQKDSVSKGEEVDQTAGTVVGAEHMEDSPASEITFDDENTELLGDSPSIQDDEIDLGVDNVEAEADAAEAGMEDEEGGEAEEGGEETPEEGGDLDLGLGDESGEESSEEGGEDELGLGDEEEEEEPTEETEDEDYDQNKDISEEGDNDEEAETAELDAEIEAPEETPEELEKSDLDSGEEEVEVEDVDIKEKPANAPRVFLKKKVKVSESLNEHHIKSKKGRVDFIIKNKENCKHTKEELLNKSDKEIEKMYLNLEKEMGITESKNIKKNSKTLNEDVQITDTVKLNGEKGYVIGQANDGDLLVQIQGSVHKVKPGEVKKIKSLGNTTEEPTLKPPYEFDKKTLQNLTTKTLFEQFVKCGIYMGNTPIKLNECYVKFSDWNNAENEKPISVIVEGTSTVFPKNQIRILENVNEFANADNYEPGVIIDEQTGEAIEDVLINIQELVQSVGDSDPVTVIKNPTGNQMIDKVPNSVLRPAG